MIRLNRAMRIWQKLIEVETNDHNHWWFVSQQLKKWMMVTKSLKKILTKIMWNHKSIGSNTGFPRFSLNPSGAWRSPLEFRKLFHFARMFHNRSEDLLLSLHFDPRKVLFFYHSNILFSNFHIAIVRIHFTRTIDVIIPISYLFII